MIFTFLRFIFNHTLKAPGYYQVEENRIYRVFPFNWSYCCRECKSEMEACRIAYELNQLKKKQ